MPRGSHITYPANVREYARRLHEQNGWSAYRIRKVMDGRVDPLPSEWAIRSWIDDEYREDRNRARRRFIQTRRRGWHRRLDRMRELRDEVQLSAAAVARLMAHDFGIRISPDQVDEILAGKRSPKTQRRILTSEAAS